LGKAIDTISVSLILATLSSGGQMMNLTVWVDVAIGLISSEA
jgi:hypothetical protein